MTALAALLCLASGFALLELGWSRKEPLAAGILLRISLAIGFGAGIFSLVFFLDLVFGIGRLWLVNAVVCAVLVAAWVLRARSASPGSSGEVRGSELPVSRQDSCRWPIWLQQIIAAAFATSFVIAIYAAIVRMRAFPYGDGWDAFTIWNLHARFLFLGGAYWRDGFTSLVGGSHPDYPLLLPAAIANFWTLLGRDDPRVPAVIGVAFTFAAAGVLFAAVSLVRGRVEAMMAAMVLLSTAFFIEQSAAQYADVPLSFFFLASVALLCLADFEPEPGQKGLLILAGLAAAFASWTKNEGQLFACSLVASRLLVLIRSRSEAQAEISRAPVPSRGRFLRLAMPLLAVLLPALALAVYYKHYIGVPGDLFSDPSSAWPKLADPSRYWAVLAGYGKGFLRFGHWLWIPGTVVLVALAMAVGANVRFTRQTGFRTSAFALIFTLAGYFVVFLITPYDIHWHLRFSLVRLFLQLWPSALFLFFIGIRDCSELQGEALSH